MSLVRTRRQKWVTAIGVIEALSMNERGDDVALMPFLMFTGQAEEAIRFYVSVFPDGEIVALERYGSNEDGDEGSIKGATFRIADQSFMCVDSPVAHPFDFTPSVSFFLDCESESELDSLYERLSEDGEVFMALGEYPFARRFTWLSDRFGVSWQLSVATNQR
jgi:predicted 3-demethylubiquinone-9 3-methyltransferase (glyoxalase superfamily)